MQLPAQKQQLAVSAAVGGAAAGPVQTVAAVQRAPMQTPTELRTIGEQISAFAAVHNAHEQHWGTLTKTELCGLQSIEDSAWQAATMECQQALLQLQQVKQTQHNAAQLNAPEQLVALYHPTKAMAFRQLAEGTPAAAV